MPVYKESTHPTKWYFRCYYTAVDGTRKQYESKRYKTKKDAKNAEMVFRSNSVPAVNIRFKEVAFSWCEYTKTNNTEKTYKRKIRMVETYFQPLLEKRIIDITARMIKQLFESKDFAKLSTSTKNTAHSYLHCIFKHGQIFFNLPSNPLDQIPRFRKTDKESLREMTIYTVDQFNTLYELYSAQYKEEAKFLYLLYWTGLRLNEGLSLTFSDFNGKSVNVHRQYVNGEWKTLKTKSSRRKVSLDKECINIVKKQYEIYSAMPGFTDEWFIFGGYKPIPDRTIERHFRDIIKKNGLPHVRIHDLRHSHVANLIESGVNPYKISKRLGHASVAFTLDRYGHLLDTNEDEILDAIGKMKR